MAFFVGKAFLCLVLLNIIFGGEAALDAKQKARLGNFINDNIDYIRDYGEMHGLTEKALTRLAKLDEKFLLSCLSERISQRDVHTALVNAINKDVKKFTDDAEKERSGDGLEASEALECAKQIDPLSLIYFLHKPLDENKKDAIYSYMNKKRVSFETARAIILSKFYTNLARTGPTKLPAPPIPSR